MAESRRVGINRRVTGSSPVSGANILSDGNSCIGCTSFKIPPVSPTSARLTISTCGCTPTTRVLFLVHLQDGIQDDLG